MARLLVLVALTTTVACGGAQRGAPQPTIPLGQARALEIIESIVERENIGPIQHNVRATLTNGTVVNIDVLATGLDAGFVYLNEQDRLDLEGEIPRPADESQLYALLATLEGGQDVHVLIMQDRDYEHLLNPRPDERRPEDSTLQEVEDRLRRDCLDFIYAVRDLRPVEE